MTEIDYSLEKRISDNFISFFNWIQERAHRTAIEKGWWETDRADGEIIALIHSELSEALEGLRKNDPPDEHCPKYKSTEVELADVIIRIMDFAEKKNYHVAGALVAKMNYNKTREYKHGGKKF